MHRTPIVLLCGAALLSLGGRAEPDAARCTLNVVGSINSIINGGYDIAQAALDCTLPDLSELACASDLTDMMSYWFNVATRVCIMTLYCGDVDNSCGADVSGALGDISDISNSLVAASTDCVSDPFICTYDIVTVVTAMNVFVEDILAALADCEQLEDTRSVDDFFVNFTEANESAATFLDEGGFFERRLRAVDQGSALRGEAGNWTMREATAAHKDNLSELVRRHIPPSALGESTESMAKEIAKMQAEIEQATRRWEPKLRRRSSSVSIAVSDFDQDRNVTARELRAAFGEVLRRLRSRLSARVESGVVVNWTQSRTGPELHSV